MHAPRSHHACVVVLGDLGRSPRMQYHAEALAAEGWTVTIIGYADDALPAELTGNPRIRTVILRNRWARRHDGLPRAVFLGLAAWRLFNQLVQLVGALCFSTPASSLILIQTPPALPTLAVAWVAARLQGARFVIDWHNFGYAMLALRLGSSSFVARSAGIVEGMLGRRADAHLCVSRAMRDELASKWKIDATVFADRPASRFRGLGAAERAAFLRAHPQLLPNHDPTSPNRDAVVVSSTSWTADEDFALLLDAARDYDRRRHEDASALPAMHLLVTGRGPLRERFEKDFAAANLDHVTLHTAWLDAADYPLALGCADLGVSLHRSASGVDLPMKVADMTGSGLRVCMLDYGPCVREMIDPRQHGMLFRTATELAALWAELLRDFPSPEALVFDADLDVRIAGGGSWLDGWRREAAPLLTRDGR